MTHHDELRPVRTWSWFLQPGERACYGNRQGVAAGDRSCVTASASRLAEQRPSVGEVALSHLVHSAVLVGADQDACVREDAIVDLSERNRVADSRIACASARLANANVRSVEIAHNWQARRQCRVRGVKGRSVERRRSRFRFCRLVLGSGLKRASTGPWCFFANALVQAWDTHRVPNDWRTNGVRVVRSDELDTNTPQTPGMTRAAAITAARAGAEKLWAGTVIIEPDAKTGAHHHGPVESVIYVVSGRARMRWGERLEYVAEAGPGDFIYVPPYVPHQEINAETSEPLSCVLARSGQEPVVVNLDLADVEPNPQQVHWVDDIHPAP